MKVLFYSEIDDNFLLQSIIKPTYCITLPYSDREYFPALLKELEEAKDRLKIVCFSITNSSLEDVFLK